MLLELNSEHQEIPVWLIWSQEQQVTITWTLTDYPPSRQLHNHQNQTAHCCLTFSPWRKGSDSWNALTHTPSHHGLILMKGMGAQVKKTVRRRKDFLPQISDSAPISGADRNDRKPWKNTEAQREMTDNPSRIICHLATNKEWRVTHGTLSDPQS